MKAESSKINKFLIGLTIISAIAAIYFGYRTNNLRDEVERLASNDLTTDSEESNRQIFIIDSLLLKGDYTNALKQSASLGNSNELKNRRDLNIKVRMANDLLNLKRKNRQLILKESENENVEGDQEVNTSVSEDSLATALTKAKNEISSLRKRINGASTSDYLTFETSKGTNLHYVGNVKNKQANGYGIALMETGSRYEGDWLNNQRHGQGKFYWDDGEIYEGEFKNDMRHGTGTYHWSNGEKYVGQWKNDMRNGEGKFYNKRGKLKAEGVWENDELVED